MEVAETMKPMSGCALIGAARALSGIRDGAVLQHSVVGCHWGSLAAGILGSVLIKLVSKLPDSK